MRVYIIKIDSKNMLYLVLDDAEVYFLRRMNSHNFDCVANLAKIDTCSCPHNL